MTMTTKVYVEKVDMCDEMKAHMLACYDNHMVIYNKIADHYNDNKYATYKDLKVQLEAILKTGEYKAIIRSALCNEIYYLHKKADYMYKSNNEIQYISGIANLHYKGKTFVYDEAALTLKVTGIDLVIQLETPLPVIEEGHSVYMNLSYSGEDDDFELAVFTTAELGKKDVVEPQGMAVA